MLTKLKKQLAESRNLITFTGIKAVGQTLGMIAPLVVAKFFVPELFASYSLARMVVFFFVSLLIASSQAPFIVFANQEKSRSGKINKVFSVELTFLVLSAVMFVALMLAFGRYIAAFAKIDRGDLAFVLLAFIGIAVKSFLAGLFMATGERIKSSLVELVFGALSVGLIFAFYFADYINIRSVLSVYFISAAVLAVSFIRAIDFKILLPLTLDKKLLREMFDFTKWVFMGVTAVYFINWGDNLVLRYFVPMADIGIYNFGYSLFKGLMVLLSSIGAYFLPFISQHINNPKKVREYLNSKRPKIFVLVLGGLVVVFIFAPYVLNLIYGETYYTYERAVEVLRILLLALVMYMYTLFYAPVFNALKEYRFIHTVSVVQVSINVVLNIALIPVLGMYGAAVATVIAYICQAVAFELYFRLKLKRQLFGER